MQYVQGLLERTDERILRSELKKVDANGFEFLIYLIKRFTETAHANFRALQIKYSKELAQTQGLKED